MLGYFYVEPKVTKELIANPKQKVSADDAPKILNLLITALDSIPVKNWSHETIVSVLDPLILSSGYKKGQMLWPLRAALTGREFSPGAYEVAAILGKEKTLERLRKVA
jgi:glutamyl-tRNA synthetase